eukprot:6211944-Pleurochrysis_carterae.AAC.6
MQPRALEHKQPVEAAPTSSAQSASASCSRTLMYVALRRDTFTFDTPKHAQLLLRGKRRPCRPLAKVASCACAAPVCVRQRLVLVPPTCGERYMLPLGRTLEFWPHMCACDASISFCDMLLLHLSLFE